MMASKEVSVTSLADPQNAEPKCNLDDINTCPSATIIKVLLMRLQRLRNNHNDSEIAQSLHSVLEKYHYSTTALMDDLHHLKYEHGIDHDDAKFDAAYNFFKDSTGNGCDIDKCRIIQRHYRDRGGRDIGDNLQKGQRMRPQEEVLLDTVSTIHFYFLHSFDTQRFTKNERDRIMKMVGSTSWTEVTEGIGRDDADYDDDDAKRAPSAMNMMTEMLKEKKGRGRSRFRDVEDDEKTIKTLKVDFAAMSAAVGIEEKVLSEGLSEYKNDRNKLIGDLVDVVYGDGSEKQPIWSTLKMDNGQKDMVFQKALYEHFRCIHLNTNNFTKLCRYIVERKKLQIDVERMEKLMNNNNIDGRMFDKGDAEHYQKNGIFAKRFKGIPDCKLQHVRQLYTALKKWKFVEIKEVTVKEEEKEDEIAEEAAADDDAVIQTTDQADVYAIGKQFLYWKSQRGHPDYVKAKFKDMKEEVMQSEALSQCSMTMKQWNTMMQIVNVMTGTKAALQIKSNGLRSWMFKIKEWEPFDSEHLCALKLYTDCTKLCAALCSILRRGDKEEIGQIANLARILTETIQCFGSPLVEEKKQKTYFRGVNKTFMFMSIVSRFNLPQSTTSDVKLQHLLTISGVSKNRSIY